MIMTFCNSVQARLPIYVALWQQLSTLSLHKFTFRKAKYARQTLRKLKYAYQTLRKLNSVHKGAKNKEQRTQIKPTSVNDKILLFGLQIITTVCSPSDLVGIFYPWCLEVQIPPSVMAEWQEGTRGFLIQTPVLYRPAIDLSCGTGLPWISHSAPRQRYGQRAGHSALVTSSAVWPPRELLKSSQWSPHPPLAQSMASDLVPEAEVCFLRGWPPLVLRLGEGCVPERGWEGALSWLLWWGGRPILLFLSSPDSENQGIRYRWHPCSLFMIRVKVPGSSFMLCLGPGPSSLLHLTRANAEKPYAGDTITILHIIIITTSILNLGFKTIAPRILAHTNA